MKIELHEIPIRDVANGYIDSAENGVVGYGGKLNIRPAFQREFIYKDKQRDEVMNTVMRDFPLNVMYWVKNEDGSYEVLDGQQRTISICQYISGDYSIDHMAFHNLTATQQERILNYALMIYICEGTDKEKLDWFKIINIAGEKLAAQELRNAIYTGPWLTEAKKYFNKYSGNSYDANTLESRIRELMQDDDITKRSGIYEYLLDGQEKHLNIRAFTQTMKRAAYERQGGICPKCGDHFELSEMQADHITPWSRGGPTTKENCQMLCADCNRRKSDV